MKGSGRVRKKRSRHLEKRKGLSRPIKKKLEERVWEDKKMKTMR